MDTPRKQRQPDPERQQLILTRNRQTHGMVLAAMLLFLVLLFGLINLLRPKSTFSENENRKLSAYPKPTLASIADGSFMSSLESAGSAQFFGRDRGLASSAWIPSSAAANPTVSTSVMTGISWRFRPHRTPPCWERPSTR